MAQELDGSFSRYFARQQQRPVRHRLARLHQRQLGYNAGPAYDQASGLGSPDAYNFIHQWTSQPPTASAVVPSINNNPVFAQTANGSVYSWPFIITLSEEAGVATTLTAFTINGASYNVATVFGTTQSPRTVLFLLLAWNFAT